MHRYHYQSPQDGLDPICQPHIATLREQRKWRYATGRSIVLCPHGLTRALRDATWRGGDDGTATAQHRSFL